MSPGPAGFSFLSPTFSPVLFAGLLARPIPLGPLNLLLDKILKQMHQRHQDVFERMQTIENPTFLIVPDDLPFSFLLHVDANRPALRAVKNSAADTDKAAASIRGPLISLIALIEGKIDGDALFFTRELTFEGDTEAVLALRNAVDGAEINLARDADRFFGSFAALARPAGRMAQRIWGRMSADLTLCAGVLMETHEKRLSSHSKAIEALEQQVRKLTKESARKKPRTVQSVL